MRALIDAVEAEAFGPVRHILHVGIGGSALGPHLLIDALGRQAGRYDVAVVSNVDGAALEEAMGRFDPSATLLVVASKTFTTRSEEHTSELQSLMRISYDVFCLKKKNKNKNIHHNLTSQQLTNTTQTSHK